jgi:glycosyltransferase involved in cell wall biosynthesis
MNPGGGSVGQQRRQRIAVVTTSFPRHPDDPAGHFVRAEVEPLRARGHEVMVLAPQPAEGAVEAEPGVRWLPGGRAFGFPGALARLRRKPLRAGFGAVRFVFAARRAIAELAPDKIIAHFLVPSAWPIARARGAGTPELEVVAHGSDVRLVARLPRHVRARIASSLAGADVRCVSEELRQELARALGPSIGRRIRVESSPLELPARLTRPGARALLGLGPDERIVLVIGRLIASKRADSALRAARAVPGARVVVVGDGPERRVLERSFPEALFVGQLGRRRALAWIAAADLLLSASREEGAPSVVREARALGTPVVAVAAGDLERWSQDDAELWVVGPAADGDAR